MKYAGHVIKNVHGYYSEHTGNQWYFAPSLQWACIFETREEAQEIVDARLRYLPPAMVGLTVQEVEFEVLEKTSIN